MPFVQSLRATLTQESASQMLAPAGMKGWLLRWSRGDLRALADLYIPYRLYKVTISDRGASTSRYYAIDGASGLLDPYAFSSVPEMREVSTRNVVVPILDECITYELAIEKMRRQLYTTGFFRLRNPVVRAECVVDEFYVPYWVGFFGPDHSLNVAVVDAVRHSVEGAKVRRVVQDWLKAQPTDQMLSPVGDRN